MSDWDKLYLPKFGNDDSDLADELDQFPGELIDTLIAAGFTPAHYRDLATYIPELRTAACKSIELRASPLGIQLRIHYSDGTVRDLPKDTRQTPARHTNWS